MAEPAATAVAAAAKTMDSVQVPPIVQEAAVLAATPPHPRQMCPAADSVHDTTSSSMASSAEQDQDRKRQKTRCHITKPPGTKTLHITKDPPKTLPSEGNILTLLPEMDELIKSLVFNFLIHKKGDISKYVSDYPPFRSVNRDNELWERLCRTRWKTKWGYGDRIKAALVARQRDQSINYWYNLYHTTNEDAKRSTITTEELHSLTFSCRTWFNPHQSVTPPTFQMRPGIMPTGLHYSVSDEIKFVPGSTKPNDPSIVSCGRVTGHPCGEIKWYLQQGGRVVNIDSPRDFSSRSRSFLVRRLPYWGWEMASDEMTFRAMDGPAAKSIKKIWSDYTSNIILEEIPNEIKHLNPSFPFIYREVPNDLCLMEKLTWIRTGKEPYD